MRIPAFIERWTLLASIAGPVSGPIVITETQAIAIAHQRIKELGYYRDPDYRAHEHKTHWTVFVRNGGFVVPGPHHFITIDKRSGKILDVRGGK